MEIPNEIMSKIMLFNSHPVADLLKPGFRVYHLEENQYAIKTYEITLITWMSDCKFGKIKNTTYWKCF